MYFNLLLRSGNAEQYILVCASKHIQYSSIERESLLARGTVHLINAIRFVARIEKCRNILCFIMKLSKLNFAPLMRLHFFFKYSYFNIFLFFTNRSVYIGVREVILLYYP